MFAQTVSIPYANEATVFLGIETAADGAGFVERFKTLCIKFRITAKKEKEETQAIPATPDSPIATGLQYFLVRNMRMVGGSQLFDHTKYPYWTPPKFHQTGEIFIIGPGISIKYPLKVSMRTTDFMNPSRTSTTLSIVS